MSQPIVPLTVPKSRHFEKKSRNEILMKIRLEKVEVTFFHSINSSSGWGRYSGLCRLDLKNATVGQIDWS
ncbi:hypothetical protein [Streptococcus suis]|uniref:hypothetical protein n=1 Tax=Streptococcus suis TaxID=1307 RepID=UPI002015F064